MATLDVICWHLNIYSAINCAHFVPLFGDADHQDVMIVSCSDDKRIELWKLNVEESMGITLENPEFFVETTHEISAMTVNMRGLTTYATDIGGCGGEVQLLRDAQCPWVGFLTFRFDGSNYKRMTRAFRQEARTFLLCCQRHRRQESGALECVPRDMRQLILVWLSVAHLC
jgi:hypothetical protein